MSDGATQSQARTYVRGRYAPSPTGDLHLGNARTALLAWWHARSAGGRFVLRMEDLDPQRSRPEAARGILTDLKWLGIDWDEGPDVGGPYPSYTQNERGERYRQVLAELGRKGMLYPCSCTRAEIRSAASAPHGAPGRAYRYPGTCRPERLTPLGNEVLPGPPPPEGDRVPSLRFATFPGRVEFDDVVHGRQSLDVHEEIGDFIVSRSDGVAAYHLAVSVDDCDQRITHVVRGDDLLETTPCQILLMRALGWEPPFYAHVPLVVDATGRRLAKRHGDLTLAALRSRKVRPERVVGLLAWSCGLIERLEEASARELVGEFSWEKLNRNPAVLTGEILDALELE